MDVCHLMKEITWCEVSDTTRWLTVLETSVKTGCVSQISFSWGTPYALWPGCQLQSLMPWPLSHPHVPALAMSPDGLLGLLVWPWERLIASSSSDDGWLVHGAHLPSLPWCALLPLGRWRPSLLFSCPLPLGFGNCPSLDCTCHRGQVKPPIHIFYSVMGTND